MKTTRGAAAYAAYSKAMGGKTFDGSRDLPTYDELGAAQQTGWTAAADTAGFAVGLGDSITTTSGAVGRVNHLSISRGDGTPRRGMWIEGMDSTGKPFEHFVLEADIAATA